MCTDLGSMASRDLPADSRAAWGVEVSLGAGAVRVWASRASRVAVGGVGELHMPALQVLHAARLVRELGGEKAHPWHASAGCCRLAGTSGLQDVKQICEAGLQDHQSDVAAEHQHLRPVHVQAMLVCAEPALTQALSTVQPHAWPHVACSPLGGLP